MVIPETRRKH